MITYANRCKAIYAEMLADGFESRAPDFAAKMCQRLRLWGGATEIRRIETGNGRVDVECWRGTMNPVPEWFNETGRT